MISYTFRFLVIFLFRPGKNSGRHSRISSIPTTMLLLVEQLFTFPVRFLLRFPCLAHLVEDPRAASFPTSEHSPTPRFHGEKLLLSPL